MGNLENPFAQGPNSLGAPVPNTETAPNPFADAKPINLQQSMQETPPHEAAYNAVGGAAGVTDLVAEGVGGAAGVALASAAGVSGPAGFAVGAGFAGVGTSLAGYLGDRLKEAYNIKDPVQRSEAEKVIWRFVGGIAGETAARGLIGVAAKFARNKAEREMITSLGSRARDFELDSARTTQDAAEYWNVRVRFDQLFPDNPEAITTAEKLAKKYPEMSTAQIAQNLEVLDAFDNLTATLGKKADGGKVSDFVHAISKDYEMTISGLQREATILSGGRTYIDEAKSISQAFRAELEASGVNFKGDLPVGPYPEGTAGLIGKYLDLQNKVKREVAGFGQRGGQVPEWQNLVTGEYRATESVQPGLPISSQETKLVPTGSFGEFTEQSTRAPLRSDVAFPSAQYQEGAPLRIQTNVNHAAELLPPNEAGEASAGLTLDYIERTRKFLQEAANFEKKAEMGTTPGEAAARRLYRSIVDIRDDINLKVFEERGQKLMADELRFYRNMNAEQRNALTRVQKLLESQPANEWRTLIDPSRPDLVQDLWAVLPDSLRKKAPGMFLDNLGDPFIVAAKNERAAFGAKAVSESWSKVDQNVKDTIYTKEQQKLVDQFFGLARAIEARQIPVQTLKDNGLVKKIVSIFTNPRMEALRNADRMTARMFVKNPDVKDFLDARHALLVPATTAEEAQKRAARSQQLADAVRRFNLGVPTNLAGMAGFTSRVPVVGGGAQLGEALASPQRTENTGQY